MTLLQSYDYVSHCCLNLDFIFIISKDFIVVRMILTKKKYFMFEKHINKCGLT